MNESAADYLRKDIALPPFHQWLRPTLIEVDDATGRVVVALPLRPEFRRDPNSPEIHGGVIGALVDIAGHAAIAGKLRHGIPTIDLRIDYLRKAAGRELRASGELLKLGRSIAVVDIRVTDDEGRLVAAGRATFSTRAG